LRLRWMRQLGAVLLRAPLVLHEHSTCAKWPLDPGRLERAISGY
jgi:hypothetical protein